MIKFLKNNITPPVIFITFLNIGFFMIVQIAFFYFIASKQIDVIIQSKAGILNTYSSFSKNTRDFINNYLNSDEFKKKKKISNLTREERLRLNRKIIWYQLRPILIVIFSIILISLLFIIYYSLTSNKNEKLKFSTSDKILVLLVIGAFTTELLFFFGIVKKHEFIGDIEIFNSVYKRVANSYNKKNN
jgi:hypothetical protein